MAIHHLHPTTETTVDVYNPAHSPVLSINSGDTIVVGSLDASGFLNRQTFPGENQPKMFSERRGHCLTGPIEVVGAVPGEMLALKLVNLSPGDWGWTVAGAMESPITSRLKIDTGLPSWLLWELDSDKGRATESRGFTQTLAPFLGVMGVAPAVTGEHSTIPPSSKSGGNIDCRELTAGSTLFLPVCAPGALLYLGDGHAAQGDGEVGGTAIECPMITEAIVEVVKDRPLDSIHAETPNGRITFGFDSDLNLATGDALDAMVLWMQSIFSVDKATALALASVSVDMRITQIANQVWGVHAYLPKGALR